MLLFLREGILMTVEEICRLIISAEHEAGELMLHAKKITGESKTNSRNIVTEYDRRVQEMLVGIFSEAFPEAHFFCEESARPDSLNAEHVFIIDPIDGTMNFAHNMSRSCISVGYMSFGEMLAGAVYNPYLNEVFSAVKGKGAFLNGSPITLPDAPLSANIACIGTSPYEPELSDRTFSVAKRLFEVCLDIRREGSAALDLCSVASGRAGVYTELQVCLWDFAAGMLIVEEAGGICLTAEGKPLPYGEGKTSILAGSKSAVEEFLRLNF